MQLRNNTVLITGGSSGIGLEFAKSLQQIGNEVIITGRNETKLENVRKEFPGIHAIRSDVSCPNDVLDLFSSISKSFPKLNVLINNAGIARTCNLRMSNDPNAMADEIKINLIAPIQMVNQFVPLLLKQPGAAIVNITSALAYMPLPVTPIYSASKAGLHSYTISLRAQLRGTSITVFEIAPPTTQTEMLKGFGTTKMKNVAILSASEVVSDCLAKMEKNQLEICPGDAKRLKFMTRLFPELVSRKMAAFAEI